MERVVEDARRGELRCLRVCQNPALNKTRSNARGSEASFFLPL